MTLATRCPQCATLFRVTPAQLQAAAGKVRCGRCARVFDGYDALAPEPRLPETPSTPASAAPPPQPQAAAPSPPSAEKPAAAPAPAASVSRRSAAGFIAATVALTLLLALQVAYAYRAEIVARSPSMRSAMENVCDFVGCRVALPQRPDLLRIEASDVHMIDPNRPSVIQLTATLRSYAKHDLAYPALDLVLTNANEHALARRVFLPDEYIGPRRDPRAGIPPNGEVTIALDLETGELNAAGFRLDVRAAPTK